MRNIISIDANNNCNCDMVYSVNDGTAALILNVKCDTSLNPILEIADRSIAITSDDFTYEVPSDLYVGTGSLQFRIVDDSHLGDYFTVEKTSTVNNTLIIAQTDNFNYSLKCYTVSSSTDALQKEIDDLSEELKKYLPLSGEGTLSGALQIDTKSNFSQVVIKDMAGNPHKIHTDRNDDGGYSRIGLESNRGSDTARTILFVTSLDSGKLFNDSVYIQEFTPEGSEFARLYGDHNRDWIVLSSKLNMHDGVNQRTVIQCLDDGDANNYGSEVIIGGNGNMYIGAGESAVNLHNTFGTSSGETLHISSDNSINFYSNCNTVANRKCLSFTSAALFPYTNGAFTLGTSSSKWGQVYSTASAISTSDRNQKHDIKDLSSEWAKALIFGLNPVCYKFNDGTSGRLHWGLIAQDVEELMMNINLESSEFAGFIKSPKEKIKDEKTGELELDLDADGNIQYDYALRYEEFIAPLIKIVQTQQKQISLLEERLSKLEEMMQ